MDNDVIRDNLGQEVVYDKVCLRCKYSGVIKGRNVQVCGAKIHVYNKCKTRNIPNYLDMVIEALERQVKANKALVLRPEEY